jgi:hypothetical protein
VAKAADLGRTIDPTIGAVSAVLGSMPEVARAWPSWSEDAQVHSYVKWGALMDRPGLAVKAEGWLSKKVRSTARR